ncbi:hypothetical protein L1987_56789 [Smallanthus sonchifolius]|uniref:Uncharacterized protein n=1 Tax=Smallanthus sonchifolius TaxID=185202 RepID=A0ACB9DAS3_9ASTR|nr:hypothetical protein L1987_56789 [Smallanthus sonchifolius]
MFDKRRKGVDMFENKSESDLERKYLEDYFEGLDKTTTYQKKSEWMEGYSKYQEEIGIKWESRSQFDEDFRKQIWDYVVKKCGNLISKLNLKSCIVFLYLLKIHKLLMKHKLAFKFEFERCEDWERKKNEPRKDDEQMWKRLKVCVVRDFPSGCRPAYHATDDKSRIENERVRVPSEDEPEEDTNKEDSEEIEGLVLLKNEHAKA